MREPALWGVHIHARRGERFQTPSRLSSRKAAPVRDFGRRHEEEAQVEHERCGKRRGPHPHGRWRCEDSRLQCRAESGCFASQQKEHEAAQRARREVDEKAKKRRESIAAAAADAAETSAADTGKLRAAETAASEMVAVAGLFERILSRCLAGVLFDERGTVLKRILSIVPSELHDTAAAPHVACVYVARRSARPVWLGGSRALHFCLYLFC